MFTFQGMLVTFKERWGYLEFTYISFKDHNIYIFVRAELFFPLQTLEMALHLLLRWGLTLQSQWSNIELHQLQSLLEFKVNLKFLNYHRADYS